MKKIFILPFCLLLMLLISCSKENVGDTNLADRVSQQLQKLSEELTEAERNNDLKSFLTYYDDNAISMPEYQPTLTGISEIEAFYKEIFQRQNIKTFQRKADEFIDLGKTIVEFGTFTKKYTDSNVDTLLTLNGKYCNIWDVKTEGNFKLKGEAFGFFHPVENPKALTVPLEQPTSREHEVYLNQKGSFELKAYNALMEKGVRIRDGELRSEFFTPDAKFMPFADSTKTGMDELKPYLIAYSSNGDVTFDSIACYTYHYENFDDYILEYAKFKVKWSVPQLSGRTEGKGIRIWKRQEDKSLKLYREIGTHNHLE